MRWTRWLAASSALVLMVCVSGCQSISPAPSISDHGATPLPKDKQDLAEALALFSYGLIHEMHRDFDDALLSYQQAIALDPDNEELYFRLAMGLLHQRRHDDAVKVMEELVERRPKSTRALRWLALIYRAADRLEDSARAYGKWVKLSPKSSAPYIQLASLLLKQGEKEMALGLLSKAGAKVDDPADVYRAMADIYLRDGADKNPGEDYREQRELAIDLLKKILAEAPNDTYSLTKLAELYVLNQDIDQAIACYEQLEGDRPDDLKVKQRLAESYLSIGKQDKAINVLEEIADQDPSNPRVYLYLGELYQQLGENDKAVAAYEKSIKADPQSQMPYLRIALIRLEDDPDGAAEMLVAGLEQVPGDERLTEMLAYVYLGSKDYSKAAAYFEKALKIAVEAESTVSPNFHFNYAIALQRAGRLKEAAVQLNTALNDNATFLDAYVQFIVRQEDEEDKQGAVVVLEELSMLQPDQARLFYYKGMLHNYLKEYEEAVASFGKVEQLVGDSEEDDIRGGQFYFWYGAANERYGEFERAVECFRTCIELEPEYAEAYNYLAYMWAERGINLEEALEFVNKALEMVPDSGAFVDTLGWIYYMQGKYELALIEIERAVELIPEDPTIMDHYGDVLLKLGVEDKALPKWKRSYVLDPENTGVADKLSGYGVNLEELLEAAEKEKELSMPEEPSEELPEELLPEGVLPEEKPLLKPEMDHLEDHGALPFPATTEPAGPVIEGVPEDLPLTPGEENRIPAPDPQSEDLRIEEEIKELKEKLLPADEPLDEPVPVK